MVILDEPPVLDFGRRGGERPVQVDLSEFEKDKIILLPVAMRRSSLKKGNIA